MTRWQWHQLDHIQIIWTSLHTDNRVSTSSLNVLQAGCSSRCPTDSTEGNGFIYITINFTRYSVTEVGALSAAGWAWSARGRHALRWEVGVAGWAWSLHGKQTWMAGLAQWVGVRWL